MHSPEFRPRFLPLTLGRGPLPLLVERRGRRLYESGCGRRALLVVVLSLVIVIAPVIVIERSLPLVTGVAMARALSTAVP